MQYNHFAPEIGNTILQVGLATPILSEALDNSRVGKRGRARCPHRAAASA